MMIPKIHLKENTYKVYKTGIPFYDAARLIGVAHLFFGSVSAEIEDRGAYWEVKGIDVRRDEEQIEWIIERERNKSHNFNQKIRQIRESLKELYQKINNNQNISFDGLPTARGGYAALVEFDAALSRGVRGVDPAGNYLLLVSVSTQRNPRGKKYNIKGEDLATASIGFCFSAVARSGNCRAFILPTFIFQSNKKHSKKRIVLSGFLNYNRDFFHNAGQHVSNVYAAISILLDLTSQKLPVTDFVYTSVCGQNVILKSGYLGFERLCSLWWKAVEENDEERLKILTQIKLFLENTARQDTDTQNQELARQLANFAVNLDVDSLCMIERLKARILASQEGKVVKRWALNLFKSSKDIKEVKKMVGSEVEIPGNIVECVAAILSLDQKGWMNKFTKLENTSSIEQFVNQLEQIISRGAYVAQTPAQTPEQEKKKERVRKAVSNIKNDDLKNLESEGLQDSRTFRVWKSIFLMDVLSRMKFGGGE